MIAPNESNPSGRRHAPRTLQPAPHGRRGTATVELAVVLPFLVALLLGVLEVGRLLDVQMVVENAVGVGGRQASTGIATNDQVQQDVINYLNAAGFATQNATVTVNDITTPGTDATQAAQLDTFQVSATIPFRDVKWAVSGFFTNNGTMVSATATFRSARVDPYPTNIQAPQGN